MFTRALPDPCIIYYARELQYTYLYSLSLQEWLPKYLYSVSLQEWLLGRFLECFRVLLDSSVNCGWLPWDGSCWAGGCECRHAVAETFNYSCYNPALESIQQPDRQRAAQRMPLLISNKCRKCSHDDTIFRYFSTFSSSRSPVS